MFNLNIVEFQGDDKLDAVKLDDNTRLDVDGVFIEIGAQPDKNFVNMLNLKNENGYVIVNNKQETSVDGIYAAGDMTNNPLKQAVTACAEGAVAANSAYKAITKKV
jgi:thioredoxin reductase (NADPH)